jgi:hypothetical protein
MSVMHIWSFAVKLLSSLWFCFLFFRLGYPLLHVCRFVAVMRFESSITIVRSGHLSILIWFESDQKCGKILRTLRRYIYIHSESLERGENEKSRVAIYFECGHASSTNNVSYLATTTTDCRFFSHSRPMAHDTVDTKLCAFIYYNVWCLLWHILH